MKQRLDVLTGIRFPAAMLVFFHHIEGHFGIPDSVFPFRRACVSGFFVLSGFLLYYIYGQSNGSFSSARFIFRRVLRIFPLHLAVLLLSFVLFWKRETILLDADATTWALSTGLRVTLLQCWFPITEFLANSGVTWSLSVLLFCYAIFPVLLKYRRFLGVILIAVLVSCAMLLWTIHRFPGLPYFRAFDPTDVVHFFPPFRLAEFILGMIVAQIYVRGISKLKVSNAVLSSFVDAGLILTCVLLWPQVERVVGDGLQISRTTQVSMMGQYSNDVAIIDSGADFEDSNGTYRQSIFAWFLYVGYAIPGSVIVYWFSRSSGILARSLSSSLFVFLGNVSFAIYLCHYQLILRIEELTGSLGFAPGASFLLCITLVMAVSILLHCFVEKPIANLTKRKPRDSKTVAQSYPTRSTDNELGGWLVIGSAIAILMVLQMNWSAVPEIRLSNGLDVNVYRAIELDDRLMVSMGWRAEHPLEGDLILFHTNKSGVVVKRTRLAKFDKEASTKLRGFRRVSVSSDQFEPGFVKLAFYERGSRTPISIHGAGKDPSRYHIIWRNRRYSMEELRLDDGLLVTIEKIELLNGVLVVDLRWTSLKNNEGLLYLRKIDALNDESSRHTVHEFSATNSPVHRTGSKQLKIAVNEYPAAQSVLLSFGRRPIVRETSLDSIQKSTPILLWKRDH